MRRARRLDQGFGGFGVEWMGEVVWVDGSGCLGWGVGRVRGSAWLSRWVARASLWGLGGEGGEEGRGRRWRAKGS